jgi:hypothetical protein
MSTKPPTIRLADMELSPNRIDALKREWEEIAGEPLNEVRQIKGAVYAFGSELACLRLERKYRWCKRASALYSTNLSTWTFELELGIS